MTSALLREADVPPLVMVSMKVPIDVVPVPDDPESQISLTDRGGQSDRSVAYTQHNGRSVTATICSSEVSRTSTCKARGRGLEGLIGVLCQWDVRESSVV